jgi:hypothetical protein
MVQNSCLSQQLHSHGARRYRQFAFFPLSKRLANGVSIDARPNQMKGMDVHIRIWFSTFLYRPSSIFLRSRLINTE